MLPISVNPVHPSSGVSSRRVGFTLLETMLGLSIFVIAGLGVMEILGLFNTNSTATRALSAARFLVNAKIAKAQTDIYTPSNGVVPVGCKQPTSGTLANQDTSDPFDFAPQNVMVIGSRDTGPVITGTMNQYVSTFEAGSGTLLISYTLNFTYRGKTYTVTQSTIRAPDQL